MKSYPAQVDVQPVSSLGSRLLSPLVIPLADIPFLLEFSENVFVRRQPLDKIFNLLFLRRLWMNETGEEPVSLPLGSFTGTLFIYYLDQRHKRVY